MDESETQAPMMREEPTEEETFNVDATILGQCHVIKTKEGETLLACPLDLVGELAKVKKLAPPGEVQEPERFEHR